MTAAGRPGLELAATAAAIAGDIQDRLERLVRVSSPSGDRPGAEAALELCAGWLPDAFTIERVDCSTAACAPDLIARMQGTGERRVLLLGHVDTVVSHDDHVAPRLDGDRLFGPGAADMKGGVVLSLGVAGALARHPESFTELSLLLVTDEEWRTQPFVHVPRFAGYDACLCFEAGESSDEGEEGIVVIRKGAGTLRVSASGRASHAGSAPQHGANALLALCEAALAVSDCDDPAGPAQLTVTPTVIRSGDALNVVPAAGELLVDLRARDVAAFERVRGAVPRKVGDVRLDARMERVWPAMDAKAATARLLAAAAERLQRPLVPRARGGASDASHFAPAIPLTVDGLGPCGRGAHTPDEFVWLDSLHRRAEIALAVALAALDGD